MAENKRARGPARLRQLGPPAGHAPAL